MDGALPLEGFSKLEGKFSSTLELRCGRLLIDTGAAKTEAEGEQGTQNSATQSLAARASARGNEASPALAGGRTHLREKRKHHSLAHAANSSRRASAG
ncbi:hypothetical protein AEGHOMDF_4032 [Methylobacterium soli]|nr:hypothetical protein AEGHOMDF_4032 [Methylobacterium soli]